MTESALNWTVLLPVIAGGLSVWYLLPSPQRRPLAFGLLGGLIAVAGAATFLVRGFGDRVPGTVEAVVFFGFATTAIVFAGLMITNRNPARSALCFAIVVLSTCGLFLLLAAPFLSAATVIIYAGAIIVTFLFVIMLSQQDGPSNANLRSREPALATAAGFILLATLLVGLQRVYDTRPVDRAIEHARELSESAKVPPDFLARTKPMNVDTMGKEPPPLTPRATAFLAEMRSALDQVRVAVPRSESDHRLTEHRLVQDVERAIDGLESNGFRLSDEDDVRSTCRTIADGLARLQDLHRDGPPANDLARSEHGLVHPVDGGPRQLPAANVSALGRTLFTDHLLAIELAGTLLLVATVGAIAIADGFARRKEGHV